MNIVPIHPQINHPDKMSIVQFEIQYRGPLNHLYGSIVEYLELNEDARPIWSNIDYETFVEYMYENSFKSKPKIDIESFRY
jgi:hypothetical protein